MSDMDTLARNLRILLRADRIIAQIHIRRALKQSVFFAVAFVVGAFGLIMLGIAGFFALEALYGATYAALIMGAVGVVLALLLALIGARVQPGEELGLAREVHNAAVTAMSTDLRAASANVSNIASIVRSPFESALPGIALQVFSTVWKLLRRRRGKSED